MAGCRPKRLVVWWSYVWMTILLILAAVLLIMDRKSWDHDREKHLRQLDRDRIEEEIGETRLTNIAFDEVYKQEKAHPKKARRGGLAGYKLQKAGSKCTESLNRTMKYHDIWTAANKAISRNSLYQDGAAVDGILEALATAKIVYVDVLDYGTKLEKGTSEKWVVTLEGGQKAMLKLDWEPETFGKMKLNGLCNYHYEMPSAEIAAFHLHRVIGFHNSVYVSGRVIDIKREILPVASQQVMKQIRFIKGSACIKGYFNLPREGSSELCPSAGLIRASLSYWIPRKLKLYTYPPTYMPFSTPNQDSWGVGLNNRTYCESLRKTQQPYQHEWYYHELFDFAVVDALMHHYDSKHYVVYDGSRAKGLTLRLDHGRAFCSHTEDYEDVMLAPIRQCCTMREETHTKLKSFGVGELSAKWKESMSTDPLAPIMDDVWMEVIERRRTKILNLVKRCADRNGGLEHVLVK